MLFGIEYINNSGQQRTAVYNAKNMKQVREIFYRKHHNTCEITDISEITSDICSLLYQSGRDIVDDDELKFTTSINQGKLEVVVDNIPSYGKVTFKEEDIHYNSYGNMIEVMINIHDGKPNWIY